MNVYELNKLSDDEKIKLIRKDWKVFLFINDPSEEVCIFAVRQNKRAIQYIKNPSRKLGMVKQYWGNIRFIENPSDEVCLMALKQNLSAIEYIKNPSEKTLDVLLENKDFIIDPDPKSIQFIREE